MHVQPGTRLPNNRRAAQSKLLAWTGLNWRPSTLLAVAFMATLISPEISISGRGLRSTWVIFLAWVIFFTVENYPLRSSILSAFSKRRFELSMLSAWLIIVLLNAAIGRGYTGRIHLIITVSLCLIIFVQITYSSIRPEAFRTVVFWTLILLGLDAARSLPMLLSESGIPRLMMLQETDPLLKYEAYISGVGDYNLYTANAIAFPVLLAVAFSFRGVKKLILLISCVCIGLAVVLSTFTAAVLIMVMGAIIFAVLSNRKWKKKFMTRAVILVLVLIIMFGIIYYLRYTEQVSRVITKSIRLYEGITEYGIVVGDETQRASLFMLSLQTSLDNPFIGVGPCTLAENPYL